MTDIERDGATAYRPTAAALPDRINRLATSLKAIEAMSLDELRGLWTIHFGPPPVLRSVDLMRLVLSWRLQARTYGGLDPLVRRKLRRKAAAVGITANLDIGTALVRDWQGQRIEVTVEEGGFSWRGQSYPSLSAIASAITGTRWNGPRFFGLRQGAS